jgi:hypothetical protein
MLKEPSLRQVNEWRASIFTNTDAKHICGTISFVHLPQERRKAHPLALGPASSFTLLSGH